jgi:hypothetical protein
MAGVFADGTRLQRNFELERSCWCSKENQAVGADDTGDKPPKPLPLSAVAVPGHRAGLHNAYGLHSYVQCQPIVKAECAKKRVQPLTWLGPTGAGLTTLGRAARAGAASGGWPLGRPDR